MLNLSLNEEAIFKVACRITADDARAEYLQQVCGSDPELRCRVERLLLAYFQQPTFLESSSTNRDFDGDFSLSRERVGSILGPYKILEKIAEGGMGVVYVAEQSEPIRRKVALKVIRPGMAGKNVVARFEAERQALAMMNHPNIARVFDGGATDEQLPYFVMELVQGLPITEYCDQQRLTIRERLELFLDVCHAVQHAHQKGIIHRDLKPSNVLVAEIDAKAVAKVIDFGVAKAIHQPLTERSIHTQFSQMIGTPLYMSPEQAGLGVIDVDTRSDVYSLGVMLYEMLTGDTPFSRQTLETATFDEMRRIIREQEPRRLSAMISTMEAKGQSTIANNRGIDSRKLRDSLRGELDWIVMKALEKDRSRRYESASDFAADIERYLHNERVEACPPSRAYALRKFANRNRGLVTAASVVGLLILIAAGLLWNERSRTLAALGGETTQREVAEKNLRTAQRQQVAAEANLKAAMDAVERLLANVSNPQLASVPGLQETWASILKESIDFYERFKANSGSSPEVDFRAAKVFLQFGHFLTITQPDTKDVIQSYLRGLELADSIVLQEPKRNDFRELTAEFHLACADYYWMPPALATPEYDARTMSHLQSAEQQYAHLSLANPGISDYQEMQGFVLCRTAGFLERRLPDDLRIVQLLQRAEELGFTANLRRAQQAARSGDLELARQYWRNEIALYRSDPDNYHSDRRKYSTDDKLYWARGVFESLVDTHPSEAEWILQEAIRFHYENVKNLSSNQSSQTNLRRELTAYSAFLLRPERQSEAVAKTDTLIQSHPAFHGVRAAVLGELGDTETRLRNLTESIQRFPEFGEYYLVRAGILENMGELESALADLTQVDDANALADYSKAIELGPDSADVRRMRAGAFASKGRLEDALADYNRAIETEPNHSYTYKRRASIHFHLGHFSDALADIAKSLEIAPEDASAIHWIHPTLVLACPDRDFQLGLSQLADQAFDMNEVSASSLAAQGLLLSALGERVRALAYINKALKLDPNNGRLSNKIAWHFATHFSDDPELTERAVELAEKAASLKPGATTWNTLGVARYRVEDFAGSIEALEKAEELSPGQYSAHNDLFLAMAHARLGQKAEAQQWYEKAVDWSDAHGADDELQRFRSEADQLLESLDMLPPSSSERRMGQTGEEDTRADQSPTQLEQSSEPVLETAGADPS